MADPAALVQEQAAPDQEQQANWNEHLDSVMKMRQAGVPWDRINQYYGAQVQKLRQAGVSQARINQYYGGDPLQGLGDETNGQQPSTPAPAKPTGNLFSLAMQGLSESSGAALLGVKPGNVVAQKGDLLGSIAEAGAETIGDLPVALPSALWSGRGVTAALAKVPGLGETPIPEATGAVIGAFSAGAGPEAIKAERDAYMAAHPGQTWSALSVAHGIVDPGGVAQKAATQGLITAGSTLVGGAVGGRLLKAGAGPLKAAIARVTAEAGTYTGLQAAAAHKPMTMTDLVDGTILLGALHVGGLSIGAMKGVRARLAQVSQETGVNPQAIAQAAKTDPVLRRQLLGRVNPPARAGSSATPTHAAPAEPNISGAPYPDHFVVPRIEGDFDSAVNFTLQHEGGAEVVDANNANVRWGINKADHPDVDVDHLTREGAAEIYKKQYWDAIDADNLPPNMRAAAFDTAVVEGVARAKKWIAASEGDPEKLLAQRAAFEAKLAQQDPAKYGRFVKAWGKRIADLGGKGDAVAMVGRDPTDPLTDEQQAWLDREGLPEETTQEPEEKTEPPELTDEQLDSEAEAHVLSRTAGEERTDWGAKSVATARALYEGLFNREHPLNRVIDAVDRGEPLDDAANPKFLRRVAENADEASKLAIVKDGYQADVNGEKVGRSYMDIASDMGDKEQQRKFEDGYARARFAVMMDETGRESGVNLDAAKRTIAKYERTYPHWKDLFKEYMGFRNNSLKMLSDSGVVSTKLAEELQSNEAALPGYRRIEGGPQGSGRRISKLISEAKGSTRQFEPMRDSMIKDQFLRRTVALHNAEHMVVADRLLAAGEATQRRLVDFNVVKAMEALRNSEIGEDPEAFDDVLASLAKSAGANMEPGEALLFRDGKAYGVKYADPDVAKLMKGMTAPEQDAFTKLLSAGVQKVTRGQVAMQTRNNPMFGPHIFGWDAVMQSIINPDAKNVLRSIADGVWATLTPEGQKVAKDLIARGGSEKTFLQSNRNSFIADQIKYGTDTALDRILHADSLAEGAWNAAKTPFHLLSAWTRGWTGLIAKGRYVQGLRAGETPIRAAMASSESKVHRPTYGGGLTRAINRFAPYMSARMSSLEKTARGMFGQSLVKAGVVQSNKTITGVKYDARQFYTMGAALITLPVLLQWAAYKDQQWYKAMPQWQKDNALLIVPPHGDWAPMVVAGPPVLQTMFGALPRNTLAALHQHDPDAFKGFLQDAAADFIPEGVTGISVLQPVIEHIANYSFFKHQPLASPDVVNGRQTPEQFNHYSSGFARNASRFLHDVPGVKDMGFSPAVIDNYVQSWGGSAGAGLVHALTGSGSPDNGALPKSPVADWPVVGAWQRMYPGANSQKIQDGYDTLQSLQKTHGSMLAAIKSGDLTDLQRIVNEDPMGAAFMHLRLQNEAQREMTPQINQILAGAEARVNQHDLQLLKQGDRAMRRGNAAAESIWENKHMTSQDKWQLLTQIYTSMQAVGEGVQSAYSNAQGQPLERGQTLPNQIMFRPPPGVQ